MKIYAPVKDANGVWASVRFINGVGETDDVRLIEWFKDHGYTVENCDISMEKPQENCDISITVEDESNEDEMMGYAEKQPDFESMTPIELREWAKSNGLGGAIKNIRSKEKLLEIIRG